MDGRETWNILRREESHGLSLLFATFCIIDLFGVFPIIALPRPISDCGWVGLPLAFLVFGLQVYTALMLGKCWTIAEYLDPNIVQKSRYPYTAITEKALGNTSGRIVTWLLDVTVLSAGIPNLIIASQNMQIIGLKLTEYQFDLSVCYWLLILGVLLCPIMWLGSPKDMKWLAAVSMLTVISVAILTWVCLLQDDGPVVKTEEPRPTWEAIAIAYGIIAFQFDIHPTILSVQVDMKDKSKLGSSVMAGFLVTGSLFTITAVIACRKYGNKIDFNLLQGLPGSGILFFDLALVTSQIFLSMVIGTSALFQDIEDKLKIPNEFNIKRCFLRSGFVMVIIFLGESVPRFDLIMGFIGGLLTGPLMFILPPIIYSKLRTMLYLEKLEKEFQQRRSVKKLNKIRKEVIRKKGALHEAALFEMERQVEGRAQISKFGFSYKTFQDGDDLKPLLNQKQNRLSRLLDLESDSEDMLLKNEVRDRALQFFQTTTKTGRSIDKLVTYSDKLFSFQECLKGDPFSVREKLICLVIIILGISATFAATFFTIKNTILYAELTPSCLMNYTAASYLSPM